MTDELMLWHKCKCFSRRDRREARNIIDKRWVIKWMVITKEKAAQMTVFVFVSVIKTQVGGAEIYRVIRARLTVRGFKDWDANYLATFSGTTSWWARDL